MCVLQRMLLCTTFWDRIQALENAYQANTCLFSNGVVVLNSYWPFLTKSPSPEEWLNQIWNPHGYRKWYIYKAEQICISIAMFRSISLWNSQTYICFHSYIVITILYLFRLPWERFRFRRRCRSEWLSLPTFLNFPNYKSSNMPQIRHGQTLAHGDNE